MLQVLSIDLWNGQSMSSKMPREFEEGNVLLTHRVNHANRAISTAEHPDNSPPRSTELALQRLYALRGVLEMLLEKLLENIHEVSFPDFAD
jgi:hypothetical protein